MQARGRPRKQIATACLTFATVWTLGAATRPALAQNPDGSDPTAPIVGETTAPVDENVTPTVEETTESQNAIAPPTGDSGAAQPAPFQQPKAESLTPRPGVPVLGGIPYIGQLFQERGQTSAMAAKTRRILVLREMLKLGLTADDIAKALPLLHRLRDAESQPPANPEQALEDEYQALLRAKPGDPLPPSSTLKLQDAARFYREEQASGWAELAKQIGAKKAGGLRELVGQNTGYFLNSGATLNPSLSYGSAATTYLRGITTLRPASVSPYGFSSMTGSATDAGGRIFFGRQGTALPTTPVEKTGKRDRRGNRRADPLAAPGTSGSAPSALGEGGADALATRPDAASGESEGGGAILITPVPQSEVVPAQSGVGLPRGDSGERARRCRRARRGRDGYRRRPGAC